MYEMNEIKTQKELFTEFYALKHLVDLAQIGVENKMREMIEKLGTTFTHEGLCTEHAEAAVLQIRVRYNKKMERDVPFFVPLPDHPVAWMGMGDTEKARREEQKATDKAERKEKKAVVKAEREEQKNTKLVEQKVAREKRKDEREEKKRLERAEKRVAREKRKNERAEQKATAKAEQRALLQIQEPTTPTVAEEGVDTLILE